MKYYGQSVFSHIYFDTLFNVKIYTKNLIFTKKLYSNFNILLLSYYFEKIKYFIF